MKAMQVATIIVLATALGGTAPARADEASATATALATPAAVAPEPTPAPAPAPEVKPAAPAPAAGPAPGSPFQIKIGDATVRFGLLLQPQIDLQENAAGATGQNMFVRRARFLVGGQITKSVFFFFETENARLGNANASGVKTMSSGFQTLDAAVEWRKSKAFNLSGGLIRVPTSRDALESASNEFTLDFNSYAFTATGVLGGMAGRDTGVMARGYLFNDRLEYRGAMLSGVRLPGSNNSFRRVGRLQYNFFDTEVYNFPSYAGSNFGKKKILALGAAYDAQLGYEGLTADLFADIPTNFGSALGTVTFQSLDGNGRFTAQLPKSEIVTIDGGLYFAKLKGGTWGRYEQRDFDASGLTDKRVLVGVNYYPYSNNFNVKLGVGRARAGNGPETNQFVVQLQAYYY